MLRKLFLLSLATAGLVALVLASASAAAPRTRYYLALGDSLSQGMQPNVQGATVDTNLGYTDDLLAIERRQIPGLTLVKLGCGGDTTTSMLTGHGNDLAAKVLHCDRKGGSQLKAAELFLKAHHAAGEVPLITLDIGANDVDGCGMVPLSQLASCVETGLATIKQNLPPILSGLKKAAPKGTKFAATTLYDPFLSYYFYTGSQNSLWSVSVGLAKALNGELTSADQAGGFLTADVADAFDTYDSTTMVPFGGASIPADVARVCAWTWACATPPTGPNIHANIDGYSVIASAFQRVLGRLH